MSSQLQVSGADFRTSAFHLCLALDSDGVCDVVTAPHWLRDLDAFIGHASEPDGAAAVAVVLRRGVASLVDSDAGLESDEAAVSKSSGSPTSVAEWGSIGVNTGGTSKFVRTYTATDSVRRFI